MRGKSLMIQGTASSVGKSVLCAALLRIFRQDGLSVAPFKAQNMALNAFVTRDGLEIGRAQATQARAAGLEPDVRMNPVLLKPTSDRRSQVIVGGRPIGSMTAAEYQMRKPELRGFIREAYDSLEREHDLVVIEGAGSPAEINLREGDVVNMAMAEAADAPVLLVGDIDQGGVFASLLGTLLWLTDEERARVKGVVINKFRGDLALLQPGLSMFEARAGVPVLGVVPYMDVRLEEEDGASGRFSGEAGTPDAGGVDVAVIKPKHIANFTDIQALALQPGVRVRYARTPRELEGADIVVLPGTKNTVEDLLELRMRGMDEAVLRHAAAGGLTLGICGGYQMLGRTLRDPLGVESSVPEARGLGLLDMDVSFSSEKRTAQAVGVVCRADGWFAAAHGLRLDGYEIHAGRCAFGPGCVPWLTIDGRTDGVSNPAGNVFGCHLHGLFDDGRLFAALAACARRTRGEDARAGTPVSLDAHRERELDRVAAVVRTSLDMDAVYRVIRGEC